MKKQHTLDMTQGAIMPALVAFAIPLLLNNVLNICYSLVDKMMLGRFVGDNAMAAAGATNAPFNLFYNMFVGFALGTLACCGQYLGAKDRENLQKSMHSAMTLSFVLGALVTVVGLLISHPLLEWLKTPPELMDDALLYFRIRYLGTTFLICTAFQTYIMSAFGDTVRVTIISSICGLCNVVLNYLFLAVIPLGVAGVALATMISEAIGCIWKGALLFSPKGEYKLQFRKLRLYPEHTKQLIREGIPNGLNTSVFTFSNMILQSAVNSFGALYVAANTCADAVVEITGIFLGGFPSACMAAVAQCYGARQFRRMKRVVWECFLIVEAGIILMGAVTVIWPRQLLGFFTDTPAVIDAAIPKLYFCAFGYLIHSLMTVDLAAMRGLKRAKLAFYINAACVCLPRVLWVWLIMPRFPNPNILYAIYPISWIIATIVIRIVYCRIYRQICHEP